MPKIFALAESMRTLQGEGVHAGTTAFFVRFASCNLWRGTQETRMEDAERSGALCPMFCDTDFATRAKLTHEDLVALIATHNRLPLAVFTGGEPLLQLTPQLVHDALLHVDMVAVETNGTQALDDGFLPYFNAGKLWITCSPKLHVDKLVIDPRDVSELKVVYPAYDPRSYEAWFQRAKPPPGRMYVQPEAVPSAVGRSILDSSCMQNAANFCIKNPQWKLSVQTHKIVGLP